MRAEGYSRLTYELEEQGESVELTVIHQMDKPGSKFIEAVSDGWPRILASLKSLLETGESLKATRHWADGGARQRTKVVSPFLVASSLWLEIGAERRRYNNQITDRSASQWAAPRCCGS